MHALTAQVNSLLILVEVTIIGTCIDWILDVSHDRGDVHMAHEAPRLRMHLEVCRVSGIRYRVYASFRW